jgi:hypothetical protein
MSIEYQCYALKAEKILSEIENEFFELFFRTS